MRCWKLVERIPLRFNDLLTGSIQRFNLLNAMCLILSWAFSLPEAHSYGHIWSGEVYFLDSELTSRSLGLSIPCRLSHSFSRFIAIMMEWSLSRKCWAKSALGPYHTFYNLCRQYSQVVSACVKKVPEKWNGHRFSLHWLRRIAYTLDICQCKCSHKSFEQSLSIFRNTMPCLSFQQARFDGLDLIIQ